MNHNRAHPSPNQSCNCNGSWISFVARNRDGRSYRNRYGRQGELARQHGIYPVAHPLRLDYMQLKKRLGGVPSRRRKISQPAFVELIKPQPAALAEYVLSAKKRRR